MRVWTPEPLSKLQVAAQHLASAASCSLGAQRVGAVDSALEAVQEVFGQAVPVARQAVPVLQDGLGAQPGERCTTSYWVLGRTTDIESVKRS